MSCLNQRAMSSFQTFAFTRIRNDPCDQSVQDKERLGPGNYQTTFLVPPAPVAMATAYQQPAVPPAAAGYGWSAQGIDVDSVLRNHAIQSNSPHCPLRGRTQARPFATVPYMGRGRGDAPLETKLQYAPVMRQGKACGTIMEDFLSQQFTPQIPYVAANVQNPVHLIPEVAAKGWVWGGVPSRQWVRDMNC
jgi:hypothetical protein